MNGLVAEDRLDVHRAVQHAKHLDALAVVGIEHDVRSIADAAEPLAELRTHHSEPGMLEHAAKLALEVQQILAAPWPDLSPRSCRRRWRRDSAGSLM